MEPYRVLLADDHVIFRQGMKRLLQVRPAIEVVGEVRNGRELLERLDSLKPDLVILDISMPGIGGIEATREIKKRHPQVNVLMLTMHKNKEYMYHAISIGAKGYLVKEDSDIELFSAIEKIQKGGIYVTRLLREELQEDLPDLLKGNAKPSKRLLSSRENEVLKLIAEGKLNKEIAGILDISIRTVENHRASIMKKLNLNKTADIVRYAIQSGIIELTF